MNVSISARHCNVPPAVRRRVTDDLRRVTRYHPRITAAEVIFDAEHGAKLAEARLLVPKRSPLVAHASDATFRGAFDQALRRLERKLQRVRGRSRARRATQTRTGPPPSV